MEQDDLDTELYENFNNVIPSTKLKDSGKTFKLKNRVKQKPLRVVQAKHLPFKQQVERSAPPPNYAVRSRGLQAPGQPLAKEEEQDSRAASHYVLPVPPKAAVKAKEEEEEEYRGCCGVAIGYWCLCCLILLLLLIIVILAADFDVKESVRSLAASPTEFPTSSPTLPTVSPTFSPSLSPTTNEPTTSPTKSPSTSPTTSPTTTFDFISTVCLGSSQEFRTSLCVTDRDWVRCEKDGSVKPQDDGNYLRTCESGDVCPCQSLHRVGISDPCVLEEDAEESESTCVGDSLGQ